MVFQTVSGVKVEGLVGIMTSANVNCRDSGETQRSFIVNRYVSHAVDLECGALWTIEVQRPVGLTPQG